MSKHQDISVERRYEKVEYLCQYAVECPHCHKDIFVPIFRQQPITLKEIQRRARETIERMKGHE